MAAERTNSKFALLTSGEAFVNSLSMMSLTPIVQLCVYSFVSCVGKRRIIPSLPPLFFQSERERERKREKEREREGEKSHSKREHIGTRGEDEDERRTRSSSRRKIVH